MPNENRSSLAAGTQEPAAGGLTLADLPRPREDHWSPQRKARVVAAIQGGLLSRAEAQTRYELSTEELANWERAYAASPAPSFAGFMLSASGKAEDQPRETGSPSPPCRLAMTASHRGGEDA